MFSLENPDPILGCIFLLDMGLLYWGLRALRLVLFSLDYVLDAIFGYTLSDGWRKDREKAESSYEHSAHVVTILARGAHSMCHVHQPFNFLLLHDKYVHPRYILENPNVTLMGTTPTHAFFCVSDPDVNVLDTKTAPFLFIKHFISAKKLVILPHSSFHKLAAEAGDPTANGKKLTYINMSARCGSTLLCQMGNVVPKVRVLSEPWVLTHIHTHFVTGRLSLEDKEQLLESSIRLLCKREPGSDIEHVLIKGMVMGSPAVSTTTKKLFPDMKLIMSTRNFDGTSASNMQIVQSIPFIATIGEYYTGKMFEGYGAFPYDDPEWWRKYALFNSKPRTLHEDVMFSYMGQLADIVRHKEDYEFVVLFEDLVKNPERECRRLFELMGISESHIPAAMEALKEDSQQGTFGKRGSRPPIDKKMQTRLENLLKEMEIDKYLGKEFGPGMSLEAYKRMLEKN